MRGAWLVKFGRWIARQETFEKMVAPAISDMQVEASCGRLHRWQHYVAIGLVMIHALFQDLRLDFVSAFGAEARRLAWKRAAIWYVGSAAFPTILRLPNILPFKSIWSAALTSTLFEGVVTGLGLAVAVGIFHLHREAVSRRVIVFVTLIAAVLSMSVSLSVRPIRNSADQVLYGSVRMRPSYSSSYTEAKMEPQIGWWKDIQSGVGLIPFAIFAVFLARRQARFRVAAAFVGFLVSWILVLRLWMEFVVSSLISPGRYQVQSEIMRGWREISLSFVLAVAWLSIDKLFQRYRHHDPRGRYPPKRAEKSL